ncbi:MAG: PHP domain-containing protein [candidate division Zixibacteria bacterium]|nr:PHP domain-containing protein [candidate division Zixibacteria bacterium]
MSSFVDLHIHSNLSDGLHTPTDVLADVRRRELTAFAVTDHDTLAGYRAVRDLTNDSDPELVPGVELSVSGGEYDLHLLAYYLDPDYTPLLKILEDFCNHRNQRAGVIVERLNGLGVEITLDDVIRVAQAAAVGRPHIATAMHASGAVSSYQMAFDKYLGNGKPAYVPKKNFDPELAISLVHEAGGVVVLAHPAIEETFQHLEMLVGLGLDGIEVYHPSHKPKQVDQFKHLAERFRLIITGGSDSHGRAGRYGEIGSLSVSEDLMPALRQRARQRKERA